MPYIALRGRKLFRFLFVFVTNFRFRFQRAAQNVEAGVSEVDPQFLAALPTNIQEEVLAQQRIEQQRQAAQANPEAPVDPGEFLQTLPGKISRHYFEFQIISSPLHTALYKVSKLLLRFPLQFDRKKCQ